MAAILGLSSVTLSLAPLVQSTCSSPARQTVQLIQSPSSVALTYSRPTGKDRSQFCGNDGTDLTRVGGRSGRVSSRVHKHSSDNSWSGPANQSRLAEDKSFIHGQIARARRGRHPAVNEVVRSLESSQSQLRGQRLLAGSPASCSSNRFSDRSSGKRRGLSTTVASQCALSAPSHLCSSSDTFSSRHLAKRQWSATASTSSCPACFSSPSPFSSPLSATRAFRRHGAQPSPSPLRASRDPAEPQASPSVAPPIGDSLELLERSQLGSLPGGILSDDEFFQSDDAESLEEFLNTKLPSHPKVHRGILANGFRYVILPNQVPPNRFEAHLEMHVGSVDEAAHEQGVAHMIEHVTFLGSKKREKLLGTGCRSNAYTDFHHTVFHVHAPVTAQGKEEPLLPMVLEALYEIAFQPQFLPSRIEKERRAVLSELQMMNTIEYRVDCQLLQQLHSENLLSARFPIGLEEQIQQWDVETIRAFHKRWYFPANATLYIVGDIGSVGRTIQMIESQFNQQPAGVFPYEPSQGFLPPSSTPSPLASPPSSPQSSLPNLFPFSLPNLSSSSSSSSSSSPTSSSSTSTSSPPSSPKSSPSLFPPFFQNPLQTLVSSFPSSNSSSAPATSSLPPAPTAAPIRVRKERHAVRPPVEHRWSIRTAPRNAQGFPAPTGAESPSPHVFQHELLQNFSMSIFCKSPVRPVQRYRDLRAVLMQRIVLAALQFRITNRYKSGSPPFLGVELDHSDSGREGCTVSTLTVTAEPRNWKGAVKVAVQEVRRLKEFGVTRGELTRYLGALLKDSEQLAAMLDSIPSLDNLDFIMESDALGHTVMDQEQGHQCLSDVGRTITLEEVNEVGASLLEYVADFSKPLAPVPAAIVACVPAAIHTVEEAPGASGASEEPFQISDADITAVIQEGLLQEVWPEPEVVVPKALVSEEEMAAKKQKMRPAFIPLPQATASAADATRWFDPATGVVQRRLSNGIRVNMKVTQNEAKGGVMRMVAPGGRCMEDPENGGAVAVGVRTLSEGGTVGNFTREQVELFCVANLINCVLESDEEFLCMDFHFTLRDGGLKATFQLLHMVLEHNVWLEDALERAKQMYLSHFRAIPKSLERATAHRLMRAMFGGDQRFTDPTPEAIQRLTLEEVKEAVLKQLFCGHLEVSIVGDFAEEDVEAYVLEYLGTVSIPNAAVLSSTGASQYSSVPLPPAPLPLNLPLFEAASPRSSSSSSGGEWMAPQIATAVSSLQHQRVLLRDTDERARAYIAGAAPNRWGLTQDGRDLNTIMDPVPPNLSLTEARALAGLGVEVVEGDKSQLFWKRRRHPLFASISLSLLAEIINARLFTTVRDALGLTYDVSFEVSLFDRLRLGWCVISVTSTPAKIQQALDASLNVVRGLHGNRVNQKELDRAKRTLLMRHESDLKDNAYWVGLLTHVQSDAVPRKALGCITDLPFLYETATPDDMYTAYNFLGLDEDSVFTCVGVAGADKESSLGAGAKAGEAVVEMIAEDEGSDSDDGLAPLPQHGRGSSTMTRPTM
eukprot:TRINITY_DN898_c0_g1_i1.p1 TRINITY_DN898_c0_g1~~TRINITY_DN898_c0_g1_i1.p1  ORF type:complete len:1519 (-),score=355.87 TRINITY_DN898_c0_g1_i1:1045-5601(-)